MAEVDAIMKELTESGELVGGEALADPSNTKTIRVVDGAPGDHRRAVRRGQGAPGRLPHRRLRERRARGRDRPALAERALHAARGAPAHGHRPARRCERDRRPRGPAAARWRRRSSACSCAATGASTRARTRCRRRCSPRRSSGRAEGVPESPRGWLVTVASRRLTDQLRSEHARRRREDTAAAQVPADEAFAPAPGRRAAARARRHADAALPLLPPGAVAGVAARAHPARRRRPDHGRDRQRLPRARGDHGPAHQPRQAEHQGGRRRRSRCRPSPSAPSACASVLHVLYLIFNEGYIASSGPDLQRGELTREAIRLTRAVHALLPDDGEVAGLLALMLLTDARRPARTRARRRARSRSPSRTAACGTAPTSRRARRSSPTRSRAPRSAPTSCRRRSPPSTTRRRARAGHRLAADPRPLRAARARRAQPDGHAQPRRRGGDGPRAARRAWSCWPRSTPTSAWPATTASTPSAPTCSRWPATTPPPATATAAAARRHDQPARAALPRGPRRAAGRRLRPTSWGWPARRPARARSGRSRSERRARLVVLELAAQRPGISDQAMNNAADDEQRDADREVDVDAGGAPHVGLGAPRPRMKSMMP